MVQGVRPAEGVRKGGEKPPLQKKSAPHPPLTPAYRKAPAMFAGRGGYFVFSGMALAKVSTRWGKGIFKPAASRVGLSWDLIAQ